MRVLLAILIVYVCICTLIYLLQERLIFFPEKTARNAAFPFEQTFEEMYFSTPDKVELHGVLFKSDHSKGLIFYLHGNAGSIESWGEIAEIYTGLHYDVFMLDYRGYGKSEGKISSERQLHQDVTLVFDQLKRRYPDREIIILGYSLGVAPAARLAAENPVNLLILQAPYYSLTDMMHYHYRVLPSIILKYKLETFKYLQKCQAPVVIFHGDRDEVIPYASSLKLKKWFKPTDTLITLSGLGHNGMSHNPHYLNALKTILENR